MKGLRTEAKAVMFADRLQSASPEEKSQLWKEFAIVDEAGGVVSESFMDAVERQLIK